MSHYTVPLIPVQPEYTVKQAIARSILQNEVVRISYTLNDETTLLAECEDYVVNGSEIKFWGTDNGDEWHVHLYFEEEEEEKEDEYEDVIVILNRW